MTDEERQNLETIAAAQMTDEQICMLMQWSPQWYREQMMNRESEVFKTVEGARLSVMVAVNKSIIDCAKQGSSPAQAMAKRLEQEMNLKRML